MTFLNPSCYLATHGVMEHGDPMPRCEGRLIKAHLIPRTKLRQEGHDVLDPRSWVWACGGIMGNGGHHGMFDAGHRPLRLPRSAIPKPTEELATELGLLWWLDRTYEEVVLHG